MTRKLQSFGAELRQRRTRAGMSLADLSELVYYSRGHLSKVETGSRQPSAELARIADATLECDGVLISLVSKQIVGASNDSAVQGDSRRLKTVNSDATAVQVDLAASLDGIELASLGQGGVDENVIDTTNGNEVARVFNEHLTQIRDAGQRINPPEVLLLLRGQVASLRSFLDRAQETARRPLLGSAARYAEYAGWMAQESGDDQAALVWTERAVQLANAADEPAMAIYALVRRALVALYRSDAVGTAELARAAQSEKGAPARILGLAALREGQGLALAGEYEGFRYCMDRAENLMDQAGDEREIERYGSMALANPVRMATGWSMHHVGRPAEGAAIIEAELARLPAGASRSFTRYAVRCALQHATSGELERACEIAHDLLPRIRELDSATITVDLRALGRTLGRWRTHQTVRPLLPEINGVLQSMSVRWK